MASGHLSTWTDGYRPSCLAVLVSLSIGYVVLSTPSLPHPTLRDLALCSAALTYFLGMALLILRMSEKPTVSATDKHFSKVTLWAACWTFILGLLFVLTTAIPDLRAMCAGGGRQGGGGGGDQIEDIVNIFMQNRRFGR